MQKGDILIAIDACKIENTDRKTLKIGKEYIITEITEKSLVITDDENIPHSFSLTGNSKMIYWKYFFNLKYKLK